MRLYLWPRRVTVQHSFLQCPSILPRIVWESRQFDKAALKAAIEAINTLVRKNKFDGIVLEAPLRQSLVPFYTSLGKTLHNTKSGKRLTLIAVLPPSVQLPGMSAEQGISPDTFKALAEHIDRFSLMTYDFSVHRGKSGPNAPIAWAKDVFKGFISTAVDESERSRLASQILMGVPFYGYDNMDAIVGHKYLEILAQHKDTISVRLDKHTLEHYATYAVKGQPHVVYYPSPYMLQQRLDTATALGGGISIWEIGQGLDYFFDLF
jgi:chitinase domain-containing protein 1